MRKPAKNLNDTVLACYDQFCYCFHTDIEQNFDIEAHGLLPWQDVNFKTYLVGSPTYMHKVNQLSLLVDQRVQSIGLELSMRYPKWHIQTTMRNGPTSIQCLLGVHKHNHDNTHKAFGAVRASLLFSHKDFRYKRTGKYVEPLDCQGYASFGYQAITAIRFQTESDKLTWQIAKKITA